MSHAPQLDGKIAIVTGGSRGIGRARPNRPSAEQPYGAVGKQHPVQPNEPGRFVEPVRPASGPADDERVVLPDPARRVRRLKGDVMSELPKRRGDVRRRPASRPMLAGVGNEDPHDRALCV